MVINEELVITKRSDEDLLRDMTKNGFPESYLSISLRSITMKKVNILKNSISGFENELEYYNKTSASELWLCDLDELEEHI